MRAILLASATRTSRGGLRASMRPSHEPAGTPLRAAQRATALVKPEPRPKLRCRVGPQVGIEFPARILDGGQFDPKLARNLRLLFVKGEENPNPHLHRRRAADRRQASPSRPATPRQPE